MAKKHLIEITDKENSKLQDIKLDNRLSNINQAIKMMINSYKLKLSEVVR